MTAVAVAAFAFACFFGGALVGLGLQRWVPGHHLGADSKDSMKLGAGLIATMSALVLGLLVSSSKSSFDTINMNFTQGAAKCILLDHLLATYGPEGQAARVAVRGDLERTIEVLRTDRKDRGNQLHDVEGHAQIEGVAAALRELAPQNDSQKLILTQALSLANDLAQARWLVVEQDQNTLPTPFLIVLLFWLTALHLAYGLFAPRNATVITVLLLCSLSISGAIYLILEMNHPLEGMIHVSVEPLSKALEYLNP